MQKTPTVIVEQRETLAAVIMHWSAHPDKDDIRTAYETIMKHLKSSEKPLFVIIDLRYNVSMPISETVSGALNGVYQHPNLVNCLVMGGHQTARTIANIIRRVSNQDRFLWFKDELELYDYLKSQSATNGA